MSKSLTTERLGIMKRESNAELARIVAMILVWHFIYHGIYFDAFPTNVDATGTLGVCDWILVLISILTIPGMDIFVLISGYFRIKLRWKSVISFWLLCSFYNVLSVVVNDTVSFSSIAHCFIISCSCHWFIKSYFWLLLASPLLNLILDNISIRNLRISILLGGFLVCCSGWVFGSETSSGYCALFLLYLYLVGGYIKRENFPEILSLKMLILRQLLCVALSVLLFIFVFNIRKGASFCVFSHSSPFVIASAVFIFCMFRKIELSSAWVNRIASTVIAVLLLSDGVFMDEVYGFVNKQWQSSGSVVFCGKMLLLIVAVFAVSFIVEYVRRAICDPITLFLSKIIESFRIGEKIGG